MLDTQSKSTPTENSPPIDAESAKGSERRRFLKTLAGLGIGSAAFQRALAQQAASGAEVTAEMIGSAEWIAGIELNDEQRENVASTLARNQRNAAKLRAIPVDADTVPALVFRPDHFYGNTTSPASDPAPSSAQVKVSWSLERAPAALSEDELAFASISKQASLLASGRCSSRTLTQLYLDRLERYDPLLKCVITPLKDLALKQAEEADARRAAGQSRGILDGIPWVAKDLIAVPPHRTTWGAEPFQEQVRPEMATVAQRLEEAGAVLLAKVTLGALAWGDRWFGGQTRNPWNPEQGSSGSSAGSASAVAAGLASFAIGSETLGSIVSPTRRCRTCGLRPTFGRVSRAGCMPLAWSMDKIGPIARHVSDLAFVFSAILGPDGKDPTLVHRDFVWPSQKPLNELRIGRPTGRLSQAEQQALDYMEKEGATIVPVDLDSELPVEAMNFILGCEATTVFDDAYRQSPDADYGRWPHTFRQSQFIPAIQYLRANRQRGVLISETETKLAQVDVVIGGDDLLLTNLTGHPSLVATIGSDKDDEIAMPDVVKLTASSYGESALLQVAEILQRAIPPSPTSPDLSLDAES